MQELSLPEVKHVSESQGRSASLRFWLMAAILALECVPVTMVRHPWLLARTAASSVIFFGVALLFFGRDKLKAVRL